MALWRPNCQQILPGDRPCRTPARQFWAPPKPFIASVMPAGLVENLGEPHDRDGVLHGDLAAVDLLEEVDQLLVAAKLGVVVLDVAGERSATFITSTWSMTASKILSRGEYW